MASETPEEQKAREDREAAAAKAKADRKAEDERLVKEAEERARKAVLADLGVESADKAKAALKAQAEAEKARLSEAERAKRDLEEHATAKTAAEAKAAAAEARALAAEERAARVERASAAGVKAGELKIALYLLGEAKAADPKLDDDAFLKGLKKERPYLFGAASEGEGAAEGSGAGRPAAHSAPGALPAPNPAVNPASPFGGQPNPGAVKDWMKATPMELQQYERSRAFPGRSRH